MKSIASFIAAARRRVVYAVILENLSVYAAIAVCLLAAFTMTDRFFTLPYQALRWWYFIAATCKTFFICRIFWQVRPSRRSAAAIIGHIQALDPALGDRLLSALELSPVTDASVSREMIDVFVARVEAEVQGLDARRYVPILRVPVRRAGRVLVIVVAAFLLVGLITPRMLTHNLPRVVGSWFNRQWQEYFTVQPGSVSVAWGTSAVIEIQAVKPLPGLPEILIERDGGTERSETAHAAGPGTFKYDAGRIARDCRYRVRWAEWESPQYLLHPQLPPQLGEFAITYQYPAYTGMSEQKVSGTPSVSCPAGTKVTLHCRSSVSLASARIVTSWGQKNSATVNKDTLEVSFTALRSGTYRIEAVGADGSFDPEPAEYPVAVRDDAAPGLEVVSPVDDIVAPDSAEIPMIVRASDDFGVSRIELVYSISDTRKGRIAVTKPSDAGANVSAEYLFTPITLSAVSGDRIRYYFEAWDNDTVTGPKSCQSEPRLIEITDQTREHEKIEAGLKTLKEELVGVLADQTMAREETRNLTQNFSSATWQAAREHQKQAEAGMKQPMEQLDGLISQMEKDPYTDSATLGEYKGLRQHLDYLRQKPMNAARERLEKPDPAGAMKEQDEVIAGLEKFSLLSEDIWQYQRMRDLMDTGDELSRISSALERSMSGAAKPDDVKAALEKLGKLLEKVNEQLSKLPHELPEDFVNSQAIKEMDVNKSKDLSQQLADAVNRGDWDAARSLASRLASSLSSMLKQMDEAGKNIGFSSEKSKEMGAQLEKRFSEIDELARAQEELSGQIDAVDAERRKKAFAAQEKLIDGLFERQRLLRSHAEKYAPEITRRIPYAGGRISFSLTLMDKVLAEFKGRRVYHSQKYLEDIINEWTYISGAADRYTVLADSTQAAAFRSMPAEIMNGEKAILNDLRNLSEPEPTAQERERMNAIAGKEKELAARTKKYRHTLEEFTRTSAILPPSVFENIDAAGGEMEAAAQSLGAGAASAAGEHGRKALEYLGAGGEGMQGAAEQMGERGQSSGAGGRQMIQMRSGGGSTGFRNAPVKLPRLDEYKAPAAFRQEIIEALKEKYPQRYEKIIKDYFRKLTE